MRETEKSGVDWQSPPQIHHEAARPLCYKQMVKDAAANLRLSKQQCALLSFYADCREGFRPARKTISQQTGIPAGTISKARGSLCDRMILTYDERTTCVTLYWDRIRAFAMLEMPLTKEEALRGRYSDPNRPAVQKLTLGDLDANYWDNDAIRWDNCPIIAPANHVRPLKNTERAFLSFLSKLTVCEFNFIFPALESRTLEPAA